MEMTSKNLSEQQAYQLVGINHDNPKKKPVWVSYGRYKTSAGVFRALERKGLITIVRHDHKGHQYQVQPM